MSIGGGSDFEYQEMMRRLLNAVPTDSRLEIESLLSGTYTPPEPMWRPEELAEAIDQLANMFFAFDIDFEFRRRERIGFGWWTVVNRQALAISDLVAGGKAADSIPNVRTALEHAIAMASMSSGSEDSITSGVVSSAMSDLDRTRPTEIETWSDLANVISDMRAEIDQDVEDEWSRKFAVHANNLGVKDVVYPEYGKLCMFVHPTLVGVIGFSNLTDNSPSFQENFWFHVMTGTPLLWAVQCQCWAALSMDRMLENGLSWRHEVVQVAERFEVPMVEELFGLLQE